MNVYIQRTVSLFLILFVSLLGLDYFQIITFDPSLRSSLYVITFILLIVSSTVVVCSDAALVHKFINYTILFLAIIGLIFSVLNQTINFLIYVVVLFSFGYSCYEMIVKN